MNPTPLSRSADPLVTRWALAGMAFCVAAFMMMYYVQLLHEAVAHGAQSRYSQSTDTAALSGPTRNANIRLISSSR